MQPGQQLSVLCWGRARMRARQQWCAQCWCGMRERWAAAECFVLERENRMLGLGGMEVVSCVCVQQKRQPGSSVAGLWWQEACVF